MSAIYEYMRYLRDECERAWRMYLEREVERASTACNGYLVRTRYQSSTRAEDLFQGSADRAYARATPELVEYWQKYPRLTKGAFEATWLQTEHPESTYGRG